MAAQARSPPPPNHPPTQDAQACPMDSQATTALRRCSESSAEGWGEISAGERAQACHLWETFSKDISAHEVILGPPDKASSSFPGTVLVPIFS